MGENGESHHKVPHTPKVILFKKEKMMSTQPCYKKESYEKREEKGLKNIEKKYI
jgi:hypothetical protein